MRFETYMKKVDNEMEKISGLTSIMISDFCYHSHFEDEFPPRETAIAALIEDFGFRYLAEQVESGEINCTVDELCDCC